MTSAPRSGFVRSVAVSALLVAAAACSGSDDSSDSEATEDPRSAIAADIRSDFGEEAVDEADATCFADGLIDALGEQDAAALNDSDQSIDEVSQDERDAVEAAFNECIPGSAVASPIVEEFYVSVRAGTDPDGEVVACVAEQIDGRTGTVLIEGVEADANDTAPPATLEVLEQCVPDEVVEALFVGAFTDQGATPEQAQCAAGAVIAELSFAELVRTAGSEELPEQVEQLFGLAANACL